LPPVPVSLPSHWLSGPCPAAISFGFPGVLCHDHDCNGGREKRNQISNLNGLSRGANQAVGFAGAPALNPPMNNRARTPDGQAASATLSRPPALLEIAADHFVAVHKQAECLEEEIIFPDMLHITRV